SERDDGKGLEFPGRTFPCLRARTAARRPARALHRAQCGRPGDRRHIPEAVRIRPLGAGAQHRQQNRAWQGACLGCGARGAAALGPGVLGRAMNAAVRFGPRLTPTGVTFHLWAPAARRVDVVLDHIHPMRALADGWYEVTIPGAGAGTLYKYRIDGKLELPDPASHFQPQDVFGPSEVIDHNSYRWQPTDWRGRAWHVTAILELHVGTFTTGGSFSAAIDKLDHVAETGLTAIELMPLADFAGTRNWGYDGVLHFAPDSAYGRPEDLKSLIDAAHARGLMVLLDVVYNH